jgi:hypothetical protein
VNHCLHTEDLRQDLIGFVIIRYKSWFIRGGTRPTSSPDGCQRHPKTFGYFARVPTSRYPRNVPQHRRISTRRVIFHFHDTQSNGAFYRLKNMKPHRGASVHPVMATGRLVCGVTSKRARVFYPITTMMANGATALSARASLSRTTVRMRCVMTRRFTPSRARARYRLDGSTSGARTHGSFFLVFGRSFVRSFFRSADACASCGW